MRGVFGYPEFRIPAIGLNFPEKFVAFHHPGSTRLVVI
jgi:hypothetical protein